MSKTAKVMTYRPVRLDLPGRDDLPGLPMQIGGRPVTAAAGDTVLTVMLRECGAVRQSEFGPLPRARAGFCLMGACQECWVTLADGRRLRACSTLAEAGMHVLTECADDRA